jgi:hypothetical protein
MPGEPVIVVGNPEHDCLSRALFYRSSKGTHFYLSAANDLGHQPTGAAIGGGESLAISAIVAKPVSFGNAGGRPCEGSI